nr:hypothetical protein [Tanacetum cinerariifolium]
MRRVGKGFSRVETPLFEGMLAAREIIKKGIAEEQVQADDAVAVAVQETIAEDDDLEVQEVVKVVTTAKLITEVVTAATSQVGAASATISAAKPSIPVAPIVVAAYTRRRKGVIIRDPKEELSSKTPAETPKLKDKGKGILIETPKPMKKKDQIELDAKYARKEDMENLWGIVKERFSTSKPSNFSDEYLLTTLKTMFEKPDGQDALILLVERRYPLSKFTLEQLVNVTRLQVEEESEMSLEVLSDLSTHTTRYISPALTQKVSANMRRVGKGFSRVETPLFEGMLAAREIIKKGIAEEQVQADDAVAVAVQETIAEDVAN